MITSKNGTAVPPKLKAGRTNASSVCRSGPFGFGVLMSAWFMESAVQRKAARVLSAGVAHQLQRFICSRKGLKLSGWPVLCLIIAVPSGQVRLGRKAGLGEYASMVLCTGPVCLFGDETVSNGVS